MPSLLAFLLSLFEAKTVGIKAVAVKAASSSTSVCLASPLLYFARPLASQATVRNPMAKVHTITCVHPIFIDLVVLAQGKLLPCTECIRKASAAGPCTIYYLDI